MIVSIPDTINHQGLERKLILKKTCSDVLNLKLKRLLPVNGYSKDNATYVIFKELIFENESILFIRNIARFSAGYR
jgi:hypothetical protein